MGIIYKITNKNNNKSYIGMTIRTLEQRWNSHISAVRQGSKFRFHSAIRKHGFDSWEKSIIIESDDIAFLRNQEERFITEYNTMNKNFGYNAKPGGCGGWIVKPENYETWKINNSQTSIGTKNSKYNGISNEEIIEIAIKICLELGYIPYQFELNRLLIKEFNGAFPKSLNGKYRTPIQYKNLSVTIKEKTNLEIKKYNRTAEHKKALSEKIKGRSWWHCNELMITRCAKKEELDKKFLWEKGRKKWQ